MFQLLCALAVTAMVALVYFFDTDRRSFVYMAILTVVVWLTVAAHFFLPALMSVALAVLTLAGLAYSAYLLVFRKS